MAMNVPTWSNAGVSPTAEKKQEGYASGECLPANHLNWIINQCFTNLTDAKTQLDTLNATQTYINGIKTNLTKLTTNLPIRIISGEYTGSGENPQFINLGATPSAVIISYSTAGYGTGRSVCITTDRPVSAGSANSAQIVTNGFSSNSFNTSGYIYNYIAFIAY